MSIPHDREPDRTRPVDHGWTMPASRGDQRRLSALYSKRFSELAHLEQKRRIWRVLCRHVFQQYVPPEGVVMDLAAGYCEFINEIRAVKKIAVDLNPDTASHADTTVQVLKTESTNLRMVEDSTVDVVFASNFFEHLGSPEELVATLQEVHRVLRPTGRLLVLQPNIRLTGARYWDFLDHRLPLTERSLEEACALADLEVVESRTRFLPYTTKSAIPQHPALVRIYLAVRPLQLLLGKQTFMVCRRSGIVGP